MRCAREEFAGALSPEPSTGLFVHFLGGDECRCGASHGHRTGPPTRPRRPGRPFPSWDSAADWLARKEGLVLASSYPYRDAEGRKAFVVVRFEREVGERDKTYRPIRRENGGWKLGDPSGPLPLYNLPAVVGATSDDIVLVAEGEKCCEILRGVGFLATTSAHGSKSPQRTDWKPLAGRDVLILPDAGEDGASYAGKVADILRSDAVRAARVRIIDWPASLGLEPGDDVEQVLERLVEQGARDEALSAALGKLLEENAQERQRQEPASASDGEERDTRKGRPTQPEILVRLATESGAEFFSSPQGDAYVTLPRTYDWQTHAVRSKGTRLWLVRQYFEATAASSHGGSGKCPSSEALQAALNALEGLARFRGPVRPTFVRVAHDRPDGGPLERLYLDLGQGARVAVVDAEGWDVEDWSTRNEPPPVRFLRPDGTQALPDPSRQGDFEPLRQFVHATEDGFVLVVAWILGAISEGPYPILVLTGEQGSGKSGAARRVRKLIDPRIPETRRPPRHEQDLALGATRCWVLPLDNVSSIPPWLSDALCAIATGGGVAARRLWTDNEESVFSVMNPVCVNGIADFVQRDDLADRCAFVRLEPIDETERRTERHLDEAFRVAHPGILGAILDAVSCAIRNLDEVDLEGRQPRMADFARWVVAAEEALPWPTGRFLETYLASREESSAQILEADEVGRVLVEWFGSLNAKPWSGTTSELLSVLTATAGEQVAKQRTWPGSHQALTAALDRLAPALRRIEGLEIERSKGAKGRRTLTIRRLESEDEDAPPAQPRVDESPYEASRGAP